MLLTVLNFLCLQCLLHSFVRLSVFLLHALVFFVSLLHFFVALLCCLFVCLFVYLLFTFLVQFSGLVVESLFIQRFIFILLHELEITTLFLFPQNSNIFFIRFSPFQDCPAHVWLPPSPCCSGSSRFSPVQIKHCICKSWTGHNMHPVKVTIRWQRFARRR